MKRLIEWLYRTAFGLNVRIQERSIGDLERRLSYLIDERTFIADEIEVTTRQLLAAQERRDRITAGKQQWMREFGDHLGHPYIPQPQPEERN